MSAKRKAGLDEKVVKAHENAAHSAQLSDIVSTQLTQFKRQKKQLSFKDQTVLDVLNSSLRHRPRLSPMITKQYQEILTELNGVLNVEGTDNGLPIFQLLELIAGYGINLSISVITQVPVIRDEEATNKNRIDEYFIRHALMPSSNRLVSCVDIKSNDTISIDSIDASVADAEVEDTTRHCSLPAKHVYTQWGLCVDPVRKNHIYVGLENKIALLNLDSKTENKIVKEFTFAFGMEVTHVMHYSTQLSGLLISGDGARLYFMMSGFMIVVDTETGKYTLCVEDFNHRSERVTVFKWSCFPGDAQDSVIVVGDGLSFITRYNVKTFTESRYLVPRWSKVTNPGQFAMTPRAMVFIHNCAIWGSFYHSMSEKFHISGLENYVSSAATIHNGDLQKEISFHNVTDLIVSHSEKSLIVVERYLIVFKVPLPFDLFL